MQPEIDGPHAIDLPRNLLHLFPIVVGHDLTLNADEAFYLKGPSWRLRGRTLEAGLPASEGAHA